MKTPGAMRRLYRRRGELVQKMFADGKGDALGAEGKRELRSIRRALDKYEMAETWPGLNHMRARNKRLKQLALEVASAALAGEALRRTDAEALKKSALLVLDALRALGAGPGITISEMDARHGVPGKVPGFTCEIEFATPKEKTE